MYSQINTICKSVNFHIRNIWRIRRFITTEAFHHLVSELVLSPLDYANSLLFGAREADLTRLQRLQNKAARLVMSCGRDQSSTDLLRELHWLPVKQRITYKLMLYIYKALNNMALVTFLPWHISRTLILLNIGNDCDPLQVRPGWLFPDLSNVPVTWALLSLLLASGIILLFIYVNRSPCL